MKPRLQFGLRTLLVVVTLAAFLCAYVGREAKWIADRREAKQGSVAALAVDEFVSLEPRSAPWPLAWLGEDGYAVIIVPMSAPNSKIDRLKELFPEAKIERDPFGQ